MGIHIGDNNRISKSTISDNSLTIASSKKKTFFERHFLLFTLIITVIAGIIVAFIMMFGFWKDILKIFEK